MMKMEAGANAGQPLGEPDIACAATFFVLDRRPGTLLPLAPRGKKGDPQSAPHHDFCFALLRVATVYLPVLPCRFPVLAAAQG